MPEGTAKSCLRSDLEDRVLLREAAILKVQETSRARNVRVAVESHSLSKLFNTGKGILGIDLRVHRGEIFGLLGPNGSGKSTLLKLMSGEIAPSSGSLAVLGTDHIQENPRARRRIGVVREGVSHFESLSGYQNAWFLARAYGVPSTEAGRRLEDLFRWADLDSRRHRPVRSYSYGMKRKLALIEALVHNPELLLLDEPSLGLDYGSILAWRDKLISLAESGVTAILATNDVDDAEKLCHRIAFIHRGRLVGIGRPQELLDQIQGSYEILLSLRYPIDTHRIAAIDGVEAVVAEGDSLRVLASSKRKVLPDIVAAIIWGGGSILSLEVRQPNLGDVFLKITGSSIGG